MLTRLRVIGLCMGLTWCGLTLGLTVPGFAQAPQPAATPPAAPAAASVPKTALPPEVIDPIKKLAESVVSAEKSLQQVKELESDLQRLRTDVERIIYESTSVADTLRPQLADVKDQIQKLGPPPAAGQPPESGAVAEERARLNSLASELDSAVKSSELAWVRAKQLIDRITVMRYQNFTRNLFERRTSPLLPSLWREVSDRVEGIFGRAVYYGNDWLGWASMKSGQLTGVVVGSLAVGGLLWWAAATYIARRRSAFVGIPAFVDRVAAASWQAPLRMLAPVAAVSLLYSGLDTLDLLFSPWERAAQTLLFGLMIYIAGSQIALAALAPRHPEWRLIPASDKTAQRLLWFVRALIGMYIIDTVLVEFGRAIYVPLSATIAQTFITKMVFASILLAMLLTPWVPQTGPLRAVNGRHEHDPMPGRLQPLWIKLPLLLITIGIVAASAAGYVALGRFIAQQVVLTGTVLAVVGLFYLGIRAFTRGREDGPSFLGAAIEARFGLDNVRQGQLVKLAEVAATLALFMLALPVILLQWGFAGEDIRDWAKALFFGFEVGQFRISLVRILIGIVLFTGLLFLTRVLQRWLRERVLAQSRMDSGVANSVEQAVGYLGIGLAALVSVSYAGFDITSLAIVAGALSVGIGFGLQSIVNNFVSGLILLVERPIKVGDWVVVGGDQGNVRRISVRSTEIETFDRASLIVPNSELIGGRVLNWTHRNLLGRVKLNMQTDGKTEPAKVIKLLEEAARGMPQILQQPAPMASLDSFSNDVLDFSLRVTLADVTQGGRIQSDLRVAILKGLREAGIYGRIAPEVEATLPPAIAPAAVTPMAPVAAPMPRAPAAGTTQVVPAAAAPATSGSGGGQTMAAAPGGGTSLRAGPPSGLGGERPSLAARIPDVSKS